jgi:Zn-finger nucleic acid-binding protein
MKQDLRCGCTPNGMPLFSAIELAPELQALQCEGCEGAALNLDDYQRWRVRSPQPLPSDTLALHQDGDADARVRACPSCARLMQRYRVGGELEFWIDRCSACQLVWFERDEWTALVDLGLSGQLRELLTDAWQRQQRDNDIAAQREAALRARHGDPCMDELARMRAWLDAQHQRDELLALLRAGW